MTDKYSNPETLWDGVDICPFHPEGSNFTSAGEWEDCMGCRYEQDQREKVMDAMMKEAQNRLRDVVTQGGPQMPPWDMLAIRLDVLLESLFHDPRNRTRYEGEVGRRTLEMIRQMQVQVKKPNLHVAKAGITPIHRGPK